MMFECRLKSESWRCLVQLHAIHYLVSVCQFNFGFSKSEFVYYLTGKTKLKNRHHNYLILIEGNIHFALQTT